MSQMQCETEMSYTEECRTLYVTQTVETPVKRCRTEFVDKCLPMMVPSSKIIKDPRTESRTFPVSVCKIDTEMDEYCATLPLAETCSSSYVSKLNTELQLHELSRKVKTSWVGLWNGIYSCNTYFRSQKP